MEYCISVIIQYLYEQKNKTNLLLSSEYIICCITEEMTVLSPIVLQIKEAKISVQIRKKHSGKSINQPVNSSFIERPLNLVLNRFWRIMHCFCISSPIRPHSFHA
jgi:hypothetical protein